MLTDIKRFDSYFMGDLLTVFEPKKEQTGGMPLSTPRSKREAKI